MKHLTLFLFCQLTSAFLLSQTSISTDIASNTTWTINNSPYIVQKTIQINSDVTLNIEPGVIIKFYAEGIDQIGFIESKIRVEGNIQALGTTAEPIVFTSLRDDTAGGDSNNDGDITTPNQGDWGSIELVSSQTNSNFRYCHFRYGGFIQKFDFSPDPLYGAINATGTSPNIEQCTFFKNVKGILAGEESRPSIINSAFQEHGWVPISMSLSAKPIFSGNTFSDNFADAIGLEGQRYVTNTNYTLSKINVAGIEGIPYLLHTDMIIGPETTLTIKPGVVIKFHTEGVEQISFIEHQIRIEGNIQAIGTADEPIVFTSINDDASGGDTNNNGDTTIPNRGDWGGVELVSNTFNSSLRFCHFKYGGFVQELEFHTPLYGAVNIAGLTTHEIKDCQFSFNIKGVVIAQDSQIQLLDSCSFNQNDFAVSIESGSCIIKNSKFSTNLSFNIENLSSQDIDATANRWESDQFLQILEANTNTNFDFIYDQLDDSSYGLVDVSNPILPPPGIWAITPNTITLVEESVNPSIIGYPFLPNAHVVFKKMGTPDLVPLKVTVLDTLHINATLSLANAETGIYDVWIINDTDTLILKNGFTILNEDIISFNEWVPFEVSAGRRFASGVLIPNDLDQLFVLVKKAATQSGSSDHWRGSLTVLGNEGEVFFESGGLRGYEDLDLQIDNPRSGFHSFEINSEGRRGGGFIKFTNELPNLSLNQWTTGDILRPFGYDWKQVDVPEGVDTFFLQAEGFGLWTQIEVFFRSIDQIDKYWSFDQSYSIDAKIVQPKEGRYYIRYLDSARLRGTADQKRNYLIQVGGESITPSAEVPFQVTELSTYQGGNNSAVTVKIYGLGFDTNDIVSLERENFEPITAEAVNKDSVAGCLYATFVFENEQAGEWNFLVSKVNGQIASAPKPFVIENENKSSLWIDLVGRNHIRVNRKQTFIIRYGNSGNTNEHWVPLWITGIPANADYELKFNISNLETPETVGINWDEIPIAIDSAGILKIPLLISHIPPGYEGTLEFSILIPDFEDINLHIWISQGIFGGNIPEALVQNPDLPSPVFDWPSFLQSSCFSAIMVSVLDILGIPDVDCLISIANYFAHIASAFSTAAEDPSIFSATQVYSGVVFGALSLSKDCGDEFAGKINKVAQAVDAALSLIRVYIECKGRIDEIFQKIKATYSSTPEEKYGPSGFDHTGTDTQNLKRYYRNNRAFKYRVDFWNAENAPAPAQEVFIVDTLDHNFDLETFEFKEFGFLDWIIEVDGGPYFNIDVDIRPVEDLIVNVEGVLDSTSREISLTYRSLDPITRQLPEDPFAGFLPPIDSSGTQIGWIEYNVQSVTGLLSGTQLANQAFVNFDGVGPWNAAPKLGPYINTLDIEPPSSSVSDIPLELKGDTIIIKWEGMDDASGLWDFTIYVSQDGAPYQIWLNQSIEKQDTLILEPGSNYAIYSTARDNVGNIEMPPDSPDAIFSSPVSAEDRVREIRDFKVFPNPSDTKARFEFQVLEKSLIKIEIYNSIGILQESILQQAYAPGNHQIVWDLSGMPVGLYYCVLRTDKTIETIQFVRMK